MNQIKNDKESCYDCVFKMYSYSQYPCNECKYATRRDMYIYDQYGD